MKIETAKNRNLTNSIGIGETRTLKSAEVSLDVKRQSKTSLVINGEKMYAFGVKDLRIIREGGDKLNPIYKAVKVGSVFRSDRDEVECSSHGQYNDCYSSSVIGENFSPVELRPLKLQGP